MEAIPTSPQASILLDQTLFEDPVLEAAELSPQRGSNTPAQGRAKRRQTRSAALGHQDHGNQALKGRHNGFQGMYFRDATVRERYPKSGWFVRAQAKHALTVVPLIIASFDCSEPVLFCPFRATQGAAGGMESRLVGSLREASRRLKPAAP